MAWAGQKGVERGGGEHVDLVDDVDAVLADLGRYADHLGKVADVVHGVVGGGVQLMDTVGAALGEGQAGLTLAAGLHVGTRVVVLPTPRGPQKRYAWASCPRRMEFFKVLAMFSWPMSDSKVSGLYFLADTINCSITDNRTNIVTTSRTPAKFLANRH